jgi:SAM-dependent methyltransferase
VPRTVRPRAGRVNDLYGAAVPDALATDREALTRPDGYGTTAPLRARASIYAYLERPVDFIGWVLDHTEVDGAEVLDVGCGFGQYLAAASRDSARRLVGLDLSSGMVSATREQVPGAAVVHGDAQALPLRVAAFDVVLAPHMLYHVPDIPTAVQELRRVVREQGVVLAVANGSAHLQELRTVVMAAMADVAGGDPRPFESFTDRFSLENGAALMEAAFDVETDVVRNRLVVPDAEPVVAYADTIRPLYAGTLFAGADWPEVMAAFGERVQARIDRDGAWTDTTESCVFVCRPR